MNAALRDREGFAAFMLRMRGAGFENHELLAAMEAVPRRGFIPTNFADAAWSHRSVPIDCGEVIEGADLQARLLDALTLDPSKRVLEIGTGSGYTAAVMSRLSDRVTTIDRFQTLVDSANRRFAELKIGNVMAKKVDGLALPRGEGPFDRIIVWASFTEVPRHMADYITANGHLICAIGEENNAQQMIRLTKIGSRFERKDLMKVRLQPLKAGLAQVL